MSFLHIPNSMGRTHVTIYHELKEPSKFHELRLRFLVDVYSWFWDDWLSSWNLDGSLSSWYTVTCVRPIELGICTKLSDLVVVDDSLSSWYLNDSLGGSFSDDWLSLWNLDDSLSSWFVVTCIRPIELGIFGLLFELVVCGWLIEFVVFRWLIELSVVLKWLFERVIFRCLIKFVEFRWLFEFVICSDMWMTNWVRGIWITHLVGHMWMTDWARGI